MLTDLERHLKAHRQCTVCNGTGEVPDTSDGQNATRLCTALVKPLKGFAAMTDYEKKKVASMGGKASHKKGTAHEFSKGSETAITAGRKGGEKVSSNREHMRTIGVLGGLARGRNLVERE
jgi:hypothetical protein